MRSAALHSNAYSNYLLILIVNDSTNPSFPSDTKYIEVNSFYQYVKQIIYQLFTAGVAFSSVL